MVSTAPENERHVEVGVESSQLPESERTLALEQARGSPQAESLKDAYADFAATLSPMSPEQRALFVAQYLYGEDTGVLISAAAADLRVNEKIFTDSPLYDQQAAEQFRQNLNAALGALRVAPEDATGWAAVLVNYARIRDNEVPPQSRANAAEWAIESAHRISKSYFNAPALSSPPPAPSAQETADLLSAFGDSPQENDLEEPDEPEVDPLVDQKEKKSEAERPVIVGCGQEAGLSDAPVAVAPSEALSPSASITLQDNHTPELNDAQPESAEISIEPPSLTNRSERCDYARKIFSSLYGDSFGSALVYTAEHLPPARNEIVEGQPSYNRMAALEYEATLMRYSAASPQMTPSMLACASAIVSDFSPDPAKSAADWGIEQAVRIDMDKGRAWVGAREAMRFSASVSAPLEPKIEKTVPPEPKIEKSATPELRIETTAAIPAVAVATFHHAEPEAKPAKHHWWQRKEKHASEPDHRERHFTSVEPAHGGMRLMELSKRSRA